MRSKGSVELTHQLNMAALLDLLDVVEAHTDSGGLSMDEGKLGAHWLPGKGNYVI